jgi:L-ribulose-5-phosphate 4-epimerase
MTNEVAGPTDLRLQELRDTAAELNHDLHRAGLVTLTFGNASVVDRVAGVVAIKPSGVACATIDPADVVLVDLKTGAARETALAASSDTATHLILYRSFPGIGAVIHTHSPYASAWAQARRSIPCLGTTHADSFAGEVPVTRPLGPTEVGPDYTTNTGQVIVECFATGGLDPLRIPGVLVAGHGPFVWGVDAESALDAATTLELVALTALATLQVGGSGDGLEPWVAEHHFARKHGPGATYGQRPRRS